MSEIINKNRIVNNTLMLYLRMGLMMFITLYTSRLVLSTLGVEDFGIYNVVGGIVVMFSFFNLTLTVAIRRYLSYEIGLLDKGNINKIFRASIIAVFIASIIVSLALETIGLWFLNSELNIPEHRFETANFVFQISILTLFFSINAIPYSAAIVSYEKMNVYAYFGIVEALLKLSLIFFLLYVDGDKLRIYSLITFTLSLFTILFNLIYCNYKVLRINNLLCFEWKDVRSIFSFSFWSILGSLIYMGATQGVNMILNVFCGVIVNAAMGIAQQINNAVSQFVSNFQTAFNPQLTKSYSSEGLSSNTFDFICQVSRLSLILITTICVPLIANIDIILELWLKEVPMYAPAFSVIMILYTAIDALAAPIYILVYAKGDVKAYQIVLSVIQLFYILFVFISCSLGFDPSVVLSSNIAIAIIMYAARCFIVKKILDFNVIKYLKEVFNSFLLPFIFFVLLIVFVNQLAVNNIIYIIVQLFVTVFIVLIINVLYLNKKERLFLKEKIKNILLS